MLSVQFRGDHSMISIKWLPLLGCTMYIVANANPLLAALLVTLRCRA
jgi:hypothetical protein